MAKRGGTSVSRSVTQFETLLTSAMAEWKGLEQRREEADRALRGYFTDELGKLRGAILDELSLRAALRLLTELLPVLNDFDLLLQADGPASFQGDENGEAARLREALLTYRRRLYTGLRRLGLGEMPIVEGETAFDPFLHEAAPPDPDEEFPGAEAVAEGTILKVRRRGYLFRNDVLQTARVVVK